MGGSLSPQRSLKLDPAPGIGCVQCAHHGGKRVKEGERYDRSGRRREKGEEKRADGQGWLRKEMLLRRCGEARREESGGRREEGGRRQEKKREEETLT
eukprot:1838336-Rhodomonas_salina.1